MKEEPKVEETTEAEGAEDEDGEVPQNGSRRVENGDGAARRCLESGRRRVDLSGLNMDINSCCVQSSLQ